MKVVKQVEKVASNSAGLFYMKMEAVQAEGDVTEQTVGGAGSRPTVCRRPVAADLASV